MKKDYIKLHVDILDDPTYGLLPDELFRRLFELFMLAGEKDQDGLLPDVKDMAWILHLDLEELRVGIRGLQERGLVEETPQGWLVTGFKESQAAPNSTERSRAFRRRHQLAADPAGTGDEDTAQSTTRCETEDTVQSTARCETEDTVQSTARCETQDVLETQRLSPYPVAGPVRAQGFDAGQARSPGKTRHRHKSSKRPVEKPVENFVEKRRKISDSRRLTTSTSSLIKFLKTSLNLKLPLLVLLEREAEKFRPSQGKTLKNKPNLPGNLHGTAALQAPQDGIAKAAEQGMGLPKDIHEPVDKTVDNFVEKIRNFSDPDEKPP